MNKLLTLMMLSTMAPFILADNHKGNKTKEQMLDNPNFLIDFAECKEVKELVGGMLFLNDGVWKEIEKDPENKEKWEEVIALSALASNYSTVYDVWCKDMINKRMKLRNKAKNKMKKEKHHKDHEKSDS
tara:strand:- start:506 stop:892 length:387 start_codon:yes stop_codon:yes gene_type:complete